MGIQLERYGNRDDEPVPISERLTRECVVVDGDPDAAEEKRRTIKFKDVETLALGFRCIACISNLQGLTNLRKLQLDNNRISKIENLSHLVHLEWLDLSFNHISKIEGLDTLTKLQDLSLYSNGIESLEGLSALTGLLALSLGRNRISAIHSIVYLRQFKKLRMLTLEGNPFSSSGDYRSHVLAHLSSLSYMDHRLVTPVEVQAALELHQDEMTEIREREDVEAAKESAIAEAQAHAAHIQAIYLKRVETLLEDLVKVDPDWPKLSVIRGLVDGWSELVEKVTAHLQEFQETMTELHDKRAGDLADWEAVIGEALAEREAHLQTLVLSVEKLCKRTLRDAAEQREDSEARVADALRQCEEARGQLLGGELEAADTAQDLLAQLEATVQEATQAARHHITAFLSAVRELDNSFFENCGVAALGILDKYSGETSHDIDAIPEEARPLLADKEALMGALATSHELHLGHLDALEERLTSTATSTAAILVAEKRAWAETRSRARIAEIVAFSDRIHKQLAALLQDSGPESRSAAPATAA